MRTDEGFDTELTKNPLAPGENIVSFGLHALENEAKSREAGRPS